MFGILALLQCLLPEIKVTTMRQLSQIITAMLAMSGPVTMPLLRLVNPDKLEQAVANRSQRKTLPHCRRLRQSSSASRTNS
ncbi:hypothetical protein LC613_34560 [Nostoc sphaeroides CHAB 2801]|uniref:hypothetical protein n=1 Tax=Nostoc sphaeroides TaxID=446679 RepID=UPI001E4669CA|nr:hypothetical protein [Nostoc sphaeroides]MCC5632713.1 hypothetical protein [Nostoc sphaeroides CHAB 2801]